MVFAQGEGANHFNQQFGPRACKEKAMSGLACACGYPGRGLTRSLPPSPVTPVQSSRTWLPARALTPTRRRAAAGDGVAMSCGNRLFAAHRAGVPLPLCSWIRERLTVMFFPLIQTQSLRKRYGDFEAVADLTLEVRGGEIFALLGPNGAGKTTTIRML